MLERFLAGVLADDTGRTSAAFVRLLPLLLLGTPGVPAQGMQALPEQIASGLRRPVRLGVWAAALGSEGRVETSDGPLSGRAVVVAADAVDSMTLTGVGADRMRGLRTWWFAADEPPDPQRLLVVDAAGDRWSTPP